MKENYLAENSLELKLPSGSSPPFYAKQRTLSPRKRKKITLRLIWSQPLADLQNSMLQPFKR